MIAPTFTLKAGNFSHFFDRLMTKVERAQNKNLERLGAWIRLVAQRSIKESAKHTKKTQKTFRRQGGEVYSRPGQPPLSKTGLLKRFIYYAYDPIAKSVVVGPAKINRQSGAPATLELGGYVMARVGFGAARHLERRRLQARPYMRPALAKAMQQKKFEQFWRNSLAA